MRWPTRLESAQRNTRQMQHAVADTTGERPTEYAADEWVFDELSGWWLDGDKVAEAMEKELDMFVPATWEECVEESGRPPISTKWVGVDKGTVQNQIIRSRLVARDFRVKGESDRSDLFAAMPPLEAKRILFRMAVRRCREKPCERNKIMLIDVKKPHLNGEVPEDEKVIVLLPSEAARLKRWLYGMHPAAKAWDPAHEGGRLPEGHLGRHHLLATEVGRELGGARGRLHGVGSGAALAGI